MRGFIGPNSIHTPFVQPNSYGDLPQPVSRWRLDETSGATRYDSVGSVDLTDSGAGATGNESPILHYGKSVQYDGTVNSTSASLPAISSWATCTLMVCVRMNSVNDGIVLGFGDIGVTDGFAISTAGGLGGEWCVYDESGGKVAANTVLNKHTTYVLAVVISGGTTAFYLNGVADGSSAQTLTPPTVNTMIGGELANFGIAVDGWVQEAMIFNSALSAANVNKWSRNLLRLNTQCAYNIDRAIAGVSNTKKPIYSTKTHATATYVRDATNWAAAAGIDLTGIPVWQSRLTNGRGVGAFVASDILIAASHYAQYQNGDTLRVVRADGTVETMTVHSSAQIGTTDIQVVRTTAGVSANIKKYKVLPTDYIDYFHDDRAQGVPAVWVNQDADALVYDLSYIYANYGGESVQFVEPTDATRDSFYELPVTGDSGCPAFIVINGEPVLITTFHGEIYGPPIHANIAEINAAITALGSAGSLTQIDITGYRDTY